MSEQKFTQEDVDAKIAEVTKGLLPQDKVDAVVKERLAREREKYSDYDDLRKFKEEHQKAADAQAQKDLESRKEYDQAKAKYEQQIKDLQGVVSQKDGEIVDMRISGALASEISSQNAYVEESMALLRKQAAYDPQSRTITIKGIDSNGIEKQYSITEGVKEFLAKRPHLVKVTQKPGAGTGAGTGTPGAGAGTQGNDLDTLNQQFLEARSRGDRKAMTELRAKIGAAMAGQRPKV